MAYMLKSKQYLETELEEAKWNGEEYKNSCEEVAGKNKILSGRFWSLIGGFWSSKTKVIDCKCSYHKLNLLFLQMYSKNR